MGSRSSHTPDLLPTGHVPTANVIGMVDPTFGEQELWYAPLYFILLPDKDGISSYEYGKSYSHFKEIEVTSVYYIITSHKSMQTF